MKLEKEVKFWPSINKWAVTLRIPYVEDDKRQDGFFDCCFDKDIKVAEKNCLEIIKRHITFVEEMIACSEKTIVDYAL